jgi:hypothetical protein
LGPAALHVGYDKQDPPASGIHRNRAAGKELTNGLVAGFNEDIRIISQTSPYIFEVEQSEVVPLLKIEDFSRLGKNSNG